MVTNEQLTELEESAIMAENLSPGSGALMILAIIDELRSHRLAAEIDSERVAICESCGGRLSRYGGGEH